MTATTASDPPQLAFDPKANPATVLASGNWRVQALAQAMESIQSLLRGLPAQAEPRWDLTQIGALDHIGAQLLWNAWGKQMPPDIALDEQHAIFFERLREAPAPLPRKKRAAFASLPALLTRTLHGAAEHLRDFVGLIGQLMLDLARLARVPHRGPWREISANIFRTGYQALGITALVGFLIGVVLSYLSSQQLKSLGADIYLVNILGMSIARELGPLLAAILVAGRSGSAITAQIGVMRVTEELDAMLVMGLPHGFRLIMPRVIAVALAMPLLVVWTDAMALLGGMAAAHIELGLSPIYFLSELPGAVPIGTYLIGILKGFVFGALIGLVACHFGLRIKADTESLGQGTTSSVVTAITVVILADALFAIVFKGVGF